MTTCRICQNASNNQAFKVKEMMYDLGESFDYFECGKCGCLQISEIPTDMGKYYPENYYSLSKKEVINANYLKMIIRRLKISSYLSSPDYLEQICRTVLGDKKFFPWIKAAGVKFDDAILDVGCGSGGLLLDLKKYGFKNLTGLDPFINGDIHYKDGPSIVNKTLDQFNGSFDFIMAHHSFEHMPRPEESLRNIHRLLNTGKSAMIRIPISSSYAWKHFGTDWVQLDAPRHFYLHTLNSIEILAEKTNFIIENVFYDSTDFQFWGSIQYQKNIPLTGARSYNVDRKGSLFSKSDIRRFQVEAKRLNASGMGDSAGFLLRKP